MGGSAATEVSEEAVKPAGSPFFVGCGDDGDAGGLVAEGELELLGGVGEGCRCCNGFGHDRPFLLRLRLRVRPDVYALDDPLYKGRYVSG